MAQRILSSDENNLKTILTAAGVEHMFLPEAGNDAEALLVIDNTTYRINLNGVYL